jgi:HEPN domain-containing protein
MKRATRECVEKAEKDYVFAHLASGGKTPLYDGVCFHCQQCAEKYLKGLMEELGLEVRKSVDLVQLTTNLIPYHPILRSVQRGMGFLSQIAVAPRYPGKSANKRQAVSALRWAFRVRVQARLLLRVHQRRRRK